MGIMLLRQEAIEWVGETGVGLEGRVGTQEPPWTPALPER